jgi:hypothetical protein
MGYNTNYKLRIIEQDEKDEYLDRLGVIESKVEVDHEEQISERYDTWFDGEVKWYEWEENMREYSKEYPAVVFELSGEGDESGDIWRCYFWNGKKQYCQARIVFDEFDEEQLR